MTKLPPDDQELVNFLRQHRPHIPPSAPELEARILQQIEAEVKTETKKSLRLSVWLFPCAIAAGLVAVVVNFQNFLPMSPNTAEVASLEAFIESNWDKTVSDISEEEVLVVTDIVIDLSSYQ